MLLLLQIKLKDANLENLPKGGILEIFTESELNYPIEGKVFLFREGLEYQTNLPKVDASHFMVRKPLAIKLDNAKEYMPTSNYQSEEVLSAITSCGPCCAWSVTDDFFDDLNDEIIKNSPKASICGYPDFTQDDPRTDGDGRECCLFKLDSLLDDNIYLGDCGIFTVTMSEEDLSNLNFDNIVCDWDCC